MDAAAVRIRLKDAQTRLISADLQLGGSSAHDASRLVLHARRLVDAAESILET